MTDTDLTDRDKTLRKGLQILDLLSASDGPRGAADLARELDMTRSNAFRLMGTLTDMGYLQRADETGRYEPTLRAWEIGMRIMGRNPLRRVAQPWLRNLHEVTGFNVYLSILDGAEILYLDKVESDTQNHISAQPGTRLPAFLVASGHAILAFQDNAVISDMIASHPRSNESNPVIFSKSLEHVRETGWSITLSGSRPDVTSIAAPVFNPAGKPVAAIAVSSATKNMPASEHDATARYVIARARSIGDSLR